MSVNNLSNIFKISLIRYKMLFPEITTKQYRVVIAYSFGISMKALSISDDVSLISCQNLLKRACQNLGVEITELRGLVLLRLFANASLI